MKSNKIWTVEGRSGEARKRITMVKLPRVLTLKF